MNLEQSHKMVKDIISREALVEYEYDFKYMAKKELENLTKVQEKAQILFDELLGILDDKGQKALKELFDLKGLENFYESEYYFERGARCGLTTLSYIKEYFKFLY